MKIRVLLFAAARDAIGAGELELEVPAMTRVDELRELLGDRYPALQAVLPHCAISLDCSYAAGLTPLWEGVEAGVIPPVSGG